MSEFSITIYSREGTSHIEAEACEIHEVLRRRGLEWKNADWAHDQQVIITIVPSVKDKTAAAREGIRTAMDALERTGLA
jgi:hypothetical protein